MTDTIVTITKPPNMTRRHSPTLLLLLSSLAALKPLQYDGDDHVFGACPHWLHVQAGQE